MVENQAVVDEPVRSVERWRLPIYTYDNLDSFLATNEFPKGVHTIEFQGRHIDMLIDLKRGAPIVFMLNGAMDRSKSAPYFYGGGVIPSWCSRVSINDPSLYSSRKLTLGWYGGDQCLKVQEVLPYVINKIADVSESSRQIFSGGSGGGFAALYFSLGRADSVAMVWNPQTDILEYNRNAVTAYAAAAFHLSDWNDISNNLPGLIDTDLCRLYGNGSVNNVVYLQNKTDWHVAKHCFPFLDALSIERPSENSGVILKDRFLLRFGDWGDGHAAPPTSVTAKVLDVLASSGFEGLIAAGDEPFL